MQEWFKLWSEGIVVAVIIGTLTELILPNNTSKKYIKTIIGLFVVYTIISPILTQFCNINIDKTIDFNNVIQTSSNAIQANTNSKKSGYSVMGLYEKHLQESIKSKLEENGYIAENVSVNIADDDSYNIERVNIKISEKIQNEEKKQVVSIVDAVKYINVKITGNESQNELLNDNEKNNIKDIISSTYGVNLQSINIQ